MRLFDVDYMTFSLPLVAESFRASTINRFSKEKKEMIIVCILQCSPQLYASPNGFSLAQNVVYNVGGIQRAPNKSTLVILGAQKQTVVNYCLFCNAVSYA